MDSLEVFKSAEFGEVRTTVIDGEPWFVAKDVADILGYQNPQRAIRQYVPDKDKGVTEMVTPGGKQEVVIINEAGLYRLMFSSNQPNAEKFTDWVTHDVLPSIRKYGYYSAIDEKELYNILSTKLNEDAKLYGNTLSRAMADNQKLKVNNFLLQYLKDTGGGGDMPYHVWCQLEQFSRNRDVAFLVVDGWEKDGDLYSEDDIPTFVIEHIKSSYPDREDAYWQVMQYAFRELRGNPKTWYGFEHLNGKVYFNRKGYENLIKFMRKRKFISDTVYIKWKDSLSV